MSTVYIALVRKQENSAFGVEFPDFPGCISAGATLDEAARGALDALELHAQGMREDGEAIPEPSNFDQIDLTGAVAILVPLADQADEVVRINITMSSRLLRKVDARAQEEGQSRSAFLAEAARAAL